MIETDEELKTPYVPEAVLEYLNEFFSRDKLLNACRYEKVSDSFSLGFMFGVQEVINHLRFIVEEQKGE